LAKRNEISSTEKLLELIRSNSRPEMGAASAQHSKVPLVKRLRSGLQNAVSIKKSITIGVDIGYNEIKLVKMMSLGHNRFELLDYAHIPFEPGVKPDHPDFSKFLKQHLSRFRGSGKKATIWGNISSARVEMRYLKIPKVPAKQIPNVVYWSHKKVAPYNEAEAVFDYEILRERVEDGAPKYDVVSLTAPQVEIEHFKGLFAKSGFPLSGISIVPFAFQNLFRTGWIQTDVKTVSSLYIGRDWSRIDIFSGGNLVLSRGIKAGIKTMNEAMRGEIIEREPEEDEGIEMPAEFLETPTAAPQTADAGRPKIDTEKAQEIFFGLVHDASPRADTEPALGPEEEEIFKMILPALERLVQQVERTFEHYAANIENERVEKIFISSGIRPHRRIVDYIGDELGLPRETFDPFTTDAQFLGNVSGPASDAERGSYAPAMGMALSDNAHTPNFLHTFKEKAKAARGRLLNKVFMICLLVVMSCCVGFYLWQGSVIDNKRIDVSRLKSRLKTYKTRVDQKLILNLVEKTRQRNEEFREFSRKYMGLVVLTEISNRTPSNVRLTSISVQVSGNPINSGETLQKNLKLEGIILGDRLTMESSLASYLLKLSDSPLFDKPAINKKEMGFFYDKEVLKFDAQLNLL